MDIFDKLVDNTLIITSSSYKNHILYEMDKRDELFNVSFFTMDDLINKIYFSYDENAIYYLMDKYNFKREIVDVYLKNMYYVEDKDYNNSKLDLLVSLKNDLIFNDLLLFDKYFMDYVKNKRVIFYKFNYFNSFEKNIISKLKNICEVVVISPDYGDYSHTVYSAPNIFYETEYVAREIVKLIDDGVCFNNIKLTNIDNDYYSVINRIFSMYNLRVNFGEDKLISSLVCKDFLELDGLISDRISCLKEKYPNSLVLDKVIGIVNKYISFSNMNVVLEMIKYDFKNTSLSFERYQNEIEVIDYENYPISSDMYVFMMSFNQNKIPVSYKDEDYITDNIKSGLFLDDVATVNKHVRQSAINNIKSIKNLIITYKKSTPFGIFNPSNLIGELGFETCDAVIDYKTSYSKKSDCITLGGLLDNYIRTGFCDENLGFLYNNYKDNKYGTYSNKFTFVDKSLFKECFPSFNLSYSSMDTFYKCPFSYYLSNVLKLNIYEEKFEAYIGSLFHYVLEKALMCRDDVSYVKTLVSKFILENDRVLSKKEKFFVDRLIPEIEFAYDTILSQLDNSNLTDMLFEKRIEVVKKGDITVIFKGFVDKIMYKSFSNKTIVAIIDYKTGYTDINLGFVPFGLSMQLPVYLYLTKNSFKDTKVLFAGFYLQRILSGPVVIDSKKSILDKKRENLLLNGYSNFDHNVIHEFDNGYKDSMFIKSMKLDKNGNFSRYSKVLDDREIDLLIDLTDKKIDFAIGEICSCNFDISPKKTEKENLACRFCKYNDICYKEFSDEVLIFEDKNLDFLGGDVDA